jgi:hypothetical protein
MTIAIGFCLDQLSASSDLGAVLAVARNLRTRSDALDRIYRTSTCPPYFFQALAEHKNTPEEILRRLAVDASPIDGDALQRALARNRSASRDILDGIAASGDVYALRNLLNSALDCGLLQKAAARLGSGDRNEVHASDQTIAAQDGRLCAAKQDK